MKCLNLPKKGFQDIQDKSQGSSKSVCSKSRLVWEQYITVRHVSAFKECLLTEYSALADVYNIFIFN